MNSEILGRLPVPELPPHLMQRIVEVLGALDDKIAANRRVLESGQALLAAQWDDLTGHTHETTPLGQIIEVSPRVSPPASGVSVYLDMKNLPEHGLLVTSWSQREPQGGARFQNGDTLVARITPCFENGKIAWVDFLAPGQIGCGSTEFLVLRARRGVPALVPYFVGASSDFRAFAAQHMTGTSGRQRVQASALAAFQVGLPAQDQLKEFGRLAETMAGRLGAARTENQVLAATRDELLPLLMSGQITVKDAEHRIEQGE